MGLWQKWVQDRARLNPGACWKGRGKLREKVTCLFNTSLCPPNSYSMFREVVVGQAAELTFLALLWPQDRTWQRLNLPWVACLRASQMAQWQKKLPANAEDSKRCSFHPLSRKWTPLLCSCQNSMDRVAGYSPCKLQRTAHDSALIPITPRAERCSGLWTVVLNHFWPFFSQTRICSPLLTPKASSAGTAPSLPPLHRAARWQDWSACSLHSEETFWSKVNKASVADGGERKESVSFFFF